MAQKDRVDINSAYLRFLENAQENEGLTSNYVIVAEMLERIVEWFDVDGTS